jgi:hypothetical protein
MSTRSVRVYKELDAPVGATVVPKSVTAIVAYGRGDYINTVRGPYQSLSELAADMDNLSGGSPNDLDEDGHSAAYRWYRDFASQGARKVYIVEPAISALQIITMSGDGSQRIFDLITDKTGGAGSLTLSPIPGTLHVEYPIATDLVENEDYIVNWSEGKIYFDVAPAAAADNIQVSWNEYIATNVETALAKLENVGATIVAGAYFSSDNGGYSLLDKLKAHALNAGAKFNYCRAFLSGYYDDITNISAIGYNIPEVSYFVNLSGYFNDNIATPSNTWEEFRDPSAHMCGVCAVRDPWVSMHDKPVIDMPLGRELTSTEITTLVNARVNFCVTDTKGVVRIKNGYTGELSGSDVYKYIDAFGLWIYAANSLDQALLDANVTGNAQITREDMTNLEAVLINKLIDLYYEKAIADPRKLYTSHGLLPVNSQLIAAIKKDESDRSSNEETYIQNAQTSREETIRCYYDGLGSIHYIDLYLGGR